MKQTRKTRSPQRTKGQKSRRARSDQIQGKRRAESPRRKSKDYYRDLVEHSRDLICTHDLEGRILSVNPLPAKILGYDPKALQQMNIRDILAPEVRHEFEAYLARIQQQGSDAGLMLVQTATGEKRVWEYSNTLRTEGVAKPIVYGMAHDVTERVHAERTLRQSEARYRELADSIADVFFAMDTDLRYTYWNKASEKLTGILAQDAIGKSLYDLFPDTPQTRRAERVYREVLRTQQPQSFINEYQLGGKDYVFEISAYPSKHGLSVFVKDITERRRAEEALRDREEWFREIFEGSRDAIFLIDADMRCVKVNRAACDLTGYSREELLHMSVPDLYEKETLRAFRLCFDAIMSGVEVTGEAWLRRRDETRVPVEFSSRKIAIREQHLVHMALRDITERKRAEEALHAARERLQTLSRRLMEVQEQERRSIAQELHDEIGQTLTTIKLSLQAAKHQTDLAAACRYVEESISITDRAIDKTRRLALDLRPPMLDDLGLVPALRWYLDHQAQHAGFSARLTADPSLGRLPPSIEIACFRIAQEALTNIARHASATQVGVTVMQEGEELVLSVEDDGVGFDVEAARERAVRGESLGLLGMEERAGLAGGSLEIHSRMGRGTKVMARFLMKKT